MAGYRPLITFLLALLVFVAIAVVSADDSGSSITTPVAQSPVGDFEGADSPTDSAVADDDAEAPDAGSLGAPVSSSSTPSSDSSSTDKTPATSASSTIDIARIAIASTATLVGYLTL